MSVEDELRRQLADRAQSVRSNPDGSDLARRIHRAERRAQRTQHLVIGAALVVIAGSSGAVLGAVATRPAPNSARTPTQQTVDTNVAPSTVPTSTTQPAQSGGGAGESTYGARMSEQHSATLDGLTINWLSTQLASPVAIVSPGTRTTCLTARVVTVSIGGAAPIAGGSGVLGLPALEPAGMAVVSSGAFGSVGHPSGWWAIVETGTAAKGVAVQFPSGATVHENVAGGVAVLAALSPAGSGDGVYSGYASAVADGAAGVTSSLEFIVGGAPATVDGAGAPTSSACAAPPAAQQAHASGPPGPITAAGEVVGAFEQAYDLDPLLGLEWSFGAVDLGGAGGCSLSSLHGLGSTSSASGYRPLPPAVGVAAVAFISPEQAVVIYNRGTGLRETGTAVLSDGSWKVSGSTYCSDMAASGASAP
jgi:hypothetical protein